MKRIQTDLSSVVLRLVAGLIFLPHGYSKVFGAGGTAAFAQDMPQFGIPAFLGPIAAYAELAGSAMLIAGLLVRLDAFLLACTMFVAAFVVQLPDAIHEAQESGGALFTIVRGIEMPLAMFAITVAVVILGPGRVSLDSLIGIEERLQSLFKKKTAAEAAARLKRHS